MLGNFSEGKDRDFTKRNDFQKPRIEGRMRKLVLPFSNFFFIVCQTAKFPFFLLIAHKQLLIL